MHLVFISDNILYLYWKFIMGYLNDEILDKGIKNKGADPDN